MSMLCSCTDKTAEIMNGPANGIGCSIYYIDGATQKLSSEKMMLDNGTNEDVVFSAYEKMCGIENTEERHSAVPEGIDTNYIKIDSGTLTIDFKPEYYTLSSGDELTLRTAAVYTFTSLDFIDYVYITVCGEPLRRTNGQAIGKLGVKDIITDGNISAEPTNYEILTLYFKSADDKGLATEIREVEVNPNQPIERYIIEQLIKGPENTDIKGVIPSDTKIREISTADGICYVDLSSDFVTKQIGSPSDAKAAVYSIVNSLGEMESVNKVQFLIEGEKIERYKDGVDISKPIEPNYDITFE